MDVSGSGEQAVRDELERVLSSAGFANNQRLSAFLRFAVERHLEGRDSELKESLIAVEVFGRRPDYDPKQDAIVRTEAVRLRARLQKYYEAEGSADTLVIELPKGGYIPCFRTEKAAPERASPPPPGFRPRSFLWTGLAAALMAFVALIPLGWLRLPQKSAPIAIAVLPLENLSNDSTDNYFADGLTDELIRNLSIIDGLTVRSRTSSFGMKGKQRNIREAGASLQVDYILEGSVLRAGRRLRIDTQLVRVRDDVALWSDRFDRELTDVFAIQDEISVAVANHLRLNLSGGRRRYETSTEAYEIYLRARALPGQRNWRQEAETVSLYRQVLAKDPRFAPALAGLASAMATYSEARFNLDHSGELAEMRSAARKAIDLDPLLAEAHDALGISYAREAQWGPSEKSFRRAIEIAPNNPILHSDLSLWLLLPLGRIEEGLRLMRLAGKIDPVSPDVQYALTVLLLSARRYDEAAEHCDRSRGNQYLIDEGELLGRARLGQRRIEDAIRILSMVPNPRYLGYAYAIAGRREEAEKLPKMGGRLSGLARALFYAGLGDKDQTLDALEQMALLGAVRVGQALHSPEFDLLSGDPRAKGLRQRVGLPE